MGIASSYCMSTSDRIEVIRHKYELLRPLMTERMRRQWAACAATRFPRGGFTLVAQATGLSRTTLWAGKRELQQQACLFVSHRVAFVPCEGGPRIMLSSRRRCG